MSVRPRAFTLVEVVVVVAIVATLLGLVLPSLSRVTAGGRQTRCGSQLRQMAIAAQHYAAIFDQWPAAILYERRDDDDGGSSFANLAWDWATTAGADSTLLGPGSLWAFSDDPDAVMECPEYRGTTNFTADPFTGYNYNTSYIGAEESFTLDGAGVVRAGVRPHACQRTNCAMFGDGGRARHGTNKFMRAPMDHENAGLHAIYSGGQAFRHLGSTNVAHLDGHVSTVGQPEEGDRATETLLDNFLGYPDNGFLSRKDTAYDPR